MSEKVTVAVLRHQDGWRVTRNDRLMKACDFRVDAEEAGLNLAAAAHRSGRDVELLVQEDKSYELRPMEGWRSLN